MSSLVAVFALILAYVAVVAAYFALRTLAKVRRATNVLARGARGPETQASLIEISEHNTERIDLMTEEITELRSALATITNSQTSVAEIDDRTKAPASAGGLRNIALVRYDAFGEMSGRMSFSLALLDEFGDGVTISAIAGGADTRVYAKGVEEGKGEHGLSPEEQQAVNAALAKRKSLLARKRSA